MPSSGIEVSPELIQEWTVLRENEKEINYILLTIENLEKFVIIKSGSAADPAAAARELLQDKEPCYILIRASPQKFYIVFYVPLTSKNALKMVFSSSLNALKSGLGTDFIISENYITAKPELTQNLLTKSTEPVDKIAAMTINEQLYMDAAYSRIGAFETESKIAADLPVKVSPDCSNTLNALKSGQISSAVFTLNTSTEELEVISQGNDTPEQLQAKLDTKTPAFIFFNYPYTNPETQTTTKVGFFIYYCPIAAPIKSKMFHSSAKSPVIKVLEAYEMKKEHGFEADQASELTTEHINNVINPPSAVVTRVAKPLPPHLRRKQQ